MNKPQIQTKNGNELITKENTNNKIRKSKFNKFFSTVTAVMIASSITLGPMTLRGEETGDGIKKYTEMKKEELKEKISENNKKIDEAKKKIDENNKAIEEAKRKEMEAKKQEMEAKKQETEAKKQEMETDKELNKLKEKCNTYLSWLVKVKKHCSEKECSVELKNKINDSEKEYNKECSELMASSSR